MQTQVTNVRPIGQLKNIFGTGNISSKLRGIKGSIPGWVSEMNHKLITISANKDDFIPDQLEDQNETVYELQWYKIIEEIKSRNPSIRDEIIININSNGVIRNKTIGGTLFKENIQKRHEDYFYMPYTEDVKLKISIPCRKLTINMIGFNSVFYNQFMFMICDYKWDILPVKNKGKDIFFIEHARETKINFS